MAEFSNKLTTYLIKSDLTDFSDIVKAGLHEYPIEGVGTFYKSSSNTKPPDWLTKFFKRSIPADLQIFTATAKGLLLVKATRDARDYIFAISFGTGRFLLQDNVIEERFGLKVVLNSVIKDSLKSIDKVSLGSTAKHSREQISKEGGAESFGIDIEQDLVGAVTGRSKVKNFGKIVSGRDAFATSAKIDIDNIGDFLISCIDRFEADDYKDDFVWIDQIKDLRDKTKILELDTLLVKQLNDGNFEKLWLVPPEIIDWSDVSGFKYFRAKRSVLFPDLAVSDLIEAIENSPILLENLTKKYVFLISSKDDQVIGQWNAYKCIYAELDIDGKFYILNGGKWYEIDQDFTNIVNESYGSMNRFPGAMIDYEHLNEGEYNQALTNSISGACCLDAKNIVHGGGKSSIEFCDIFTADNRLIHVKRYSGSAQLSHLFAQGVNSAALLLQDSAFREKLNEKLPEARRFVDSRSRPNPSDYEIIFAIVSKSANELDIPFFSKVTLKNARRVLEGYGFRVSLKKIQAITHEDDEDGDAVIEADP